MRNTLYMQKGHKLLLKTYLKLHRSRKTEVQEWSGNIKQQNLKNDDELCQEESSGDWQISKSGLLNIYGWKRGRVGVKQYMHSFHCYYCLLEISFYNYMSKLFPIFCIE